MGDALFDLEQVLITKRGKLSIEEARVIPSCKSNAVRDLTVGALAGGTAVWAATWKLSKPFRINLSAGAGVFFGLWMLERSLYSCVDHILTLDGTILQKELANIMVTKYHDKPSVMQLISKHFYSERLFDDSTSNTPKFRWRYRNFYSDNVVHGQTTHDPDSYDKSQGDSHNDSYEKSQGDSLNDSSGKSKSKSENVTGSKKSNLETKQIFTKPGTDIMSEVDPLDCLFGYGGAPVEEIRGPNTSNKQSGTHNRGHRRLHRRRRMRNHNDLSNSEQL
ncbi:uncharacterized protein LOC130741390 [Lotus japonicus]|uniref:uncharacterized protein LOC130741390 n=1 Tax=Lotus japonicus TaxID=34305 RepID=UPI002589BB57|nr:uncharacterized protein LOC130741390 [Lotus japonicus]